MSQYVGQESMRGFLKRIEGRRDLFLERLRQLVEAESPSDSPAGVNRAGALVESWATNLGGRSRRYPGAGFGDVLELRFGPDSPGGLLLLGHLDTVWPLGTLGAMSWREADGCFWGPGVLDMKAGVVMALEAIAAVQAGPAGLQRGVTLLLNPDEEVGSPLSRAHTERLARGSEAVFVLEPAQGLAYKTARKGVGHFELRVEGIGAHAGVDFEKGHSAVLEAARLIEQVSAWTDAGRGRTVNAGVIHGGTRSNVVAAECCIEVDARVVTQEDAAVVEALFAGLQVTDPACKLSIHGGVNRPPMERSPGSLALFEQARRLAANLGLALDEASTGGGSDGNFTAALGVPTLDGMGAVGAGAHARHEHVVVAHLAERTALLAGMIAGEGAA